jgi:hypothetical protein
MGSPRGGGARGGENAQQQVRIYQFASFYTRPVIQNIEFMVNLTHVIIKFAQGHQGPGFTTS